MRLRPGTMIRMKHWDGRYRVLDDNSCFKAPAFTSGEDYLLLDVNEWRLGWERREVVEDPNKFEIYPEVK